MTQPTGDEDEAGASGYVRLVLHVMSRNNVSSRELERRTALSRHRLRAMFKSGNMTVHEQEVVFEHLAIDPHCAFLAVYRFNDPEAYYSPIVSMAASLADHLARELNDEASARIGDFEPIRKSLLNGLAKDVATRVMAHQERSREHKEKFLG